MELKYKKVLHILRNRKFDAMNFVELLDDLKPQIISGVLKSNETLLDNLYSDTVSLNSEVLIQKHFIDCYHQYHNDLDRIVFKHISSIENEYIRELMKFSIRHLISQNSLNYPTIENEFFIKFLKLRE